MAVSLLQSIRSETSAKIFSRTKTILSILINIHVIVRMSSFFLGFPQFFLRPAQDSGSTERPYRKSLDHRPNSKPRLRGNNRVCLLRDSFLQKSNKSHVEWLLQRSFGCRIISRRLMSCRSDQIIEKRQRTGIKYDRKRKGISAQQAS
jgi:hypothetical protein